MVLRDIDYVRRKLDWMREHAIWPNGLRYLWTDAFGLVLYTSLYEETGESDWLDAAQHLVDEVNRVLGRRRGLRIGEEPDRDGQYYHYLIMWIFALHVYGRYHPASREEAVRLARQIHPRFVLPGRGVIWKMQEDLSGPYPGYGFGSLDAFDGYVIYRLVDESALAEEIAQMRELLQRDWHDLIIDQDLGLGMMLWLSHFFPDEDWAVAQRDRSLGHLDRLWQEDEGYFCRQRGLRRMHFAFTNYGIALGLQAVDVTPERVSRLNDYFDGYRSGDEYDVNAITHVMACTAHFPGLFLREALSLPPRDQQKWGRRE